MGVFKWIFGYSSPKVEWEYGQSPPREEPPEEFAEKNNAEVCNLIMIPICGEWLAFGDYEYYAAGSWSPGTGVRRRIHGR